MDQQEGSNEQDNRDDDSNWMAALLEDVFFHDVKNVLQETLLPQAQAIQENIKVLSEQTIFEGEHPSSVSF